MVIKGIDLNMKWNDYSSDTLYLWNGNTVFKIAEGNGSNLLKEDEEEGYIDYWMTDYASNEDGNGGQWLETELISDIDYTIQGVIDRMMECDLWDDVWTIIDMNLGELLIDFFEKSWEVNRVLKEKGLVIEKG